MPRKPTSAPGHWAFPKEGPPYFVSEELPDNNADVEARVVQAFTDRLLDRHYDVQEVSRPQGDWPDAALRVDGRLVGLELVEVVDPGHRRAVMGQPWYLQELRKAFVAKSLDSALAGMNLQLENPDAGLPPAMSGAARQLVLAMAECMEKRRDIFAASHPGQLQRVTFDVPPWRVELFGWRVAEGASDLGIRWGGAYTVDKHCLAHAVRKKIQKQYSQSSEFDVLWLLAWDSFGYLITSSEEPAVRILDSEPHPFQEVWTCFIGAAGAGSIAHLWPEPREPIVDEVDLAFGPSGG